MAPRLWVVTTKVSGALVAAAWIDRVHVDPERAGGQRERLERVVARPRHRRTASSANPKYGGEVEEELVGGWRRPRVWAPREDADHRQRHVRREPSSPSGSTTPTGGTTAAGGGRRLARQMVGSAAMQPPGRPSGCCWLHVGKPCLQGRVPTARTSATVDRAPPPARADARRARSPPSRTFPENPPTASSAFRRKTMFVAANRNMVPRAIFSRERSLRKKERLLRPGRPPRHRFSPPALA